MPNVPTFTTSPGAVGTGAAAPLLDVGSAAAPYVAQARAGQALSNIGDQFAQKYIGAKMEVAAADQTSELSKAVREIEFKAGKIPDRALATAHYDTETSKLIEAWGQQDNNYFIKAKVQASMANEVALRRASAQQASWTLESQVAAGKLDEQLDDISKEASNAKDERLREENLKRGVDFIDGRVAAGMINPEAAAEKKIKFQSAVYKNIISTAMARDPAEGVAAWKTYGSKLSATDQQQMRVVAASAEKGVEIDNKASGLIAGPTGTVSAAMAPIVAQFPELKSRITSTDRGAGHNAAVGGASDSQHLHPDTAMDISLAGLDEQTKQKVLNEILANPNLKGFGYYPQSDSIHVDTGNRAARTAWGTGGTSSTVGQQWPAWLTERVRAWQKGGSGDDFATRTVARMGRIADYVANPANGADRFSVAAKAQSVLSADVAHNSAQKKQTTDEFDLAMSNLVLRGGKNYALGTFDGLADRMQAAGDHSMAAIYRDFGKAEQELMNFGTLTPTQQRQYAHSIPGEAGRLIRASLEGRSKEQADALRAANEAARTVSQTISNADNPELARPFAEEAVNQFNLAGRPLLAKRLAQEFAGHSEGFKLGKGTPLDLEERKRRIQSIVDEGGGNLGAVLALQKTFDAIAAKSQEKWKHDPVQAWADMAGVTLAPPPDPKDPAYQVKLQAFEESRAGAARAAQNAYYQGAGIAPKAQVFSSATAMEASVWKQGLAAGNLQQVQASVMAKAMAMPADMIAPLAQQLGGNNHEDSFGNSVASTMWFYKRGQPGDRETGDRILEGALLRQRGGPEAKGSVSLGDAAVLDTFKTTLGNARAGLYQAPETIRMLDDAALSLYASEMKGRPESAYQDRVMQKAITAIYGERYKGMHGDVLLPTGIDANQFRHGVYSLTDADVPAYKVGTQTLTADMVRRGAAKLVTVGDGIYKVQVPSPTGSAMLDVPGSNGQPWTIDIRELAARPRDLARPPQPMGPRGTTEIPVPR